MSNIDNIFLTGFGWITPTGYIVSCPMYNHLEILAKNEDIPGMNEDLQFMINEGLDEIHEVGLGCQQADDE